MRSPVSQTGIGEAASTTGSFMPAKPAAAPAPSAGRQAALAHDEGGDVGHALVLLEVGKKKRPGAAHAACIAIHDVEVGAAQRRQVDLVDHQRGGPGEARTALAG